VLHPHGDINASRIVAAWLHKPSSHAANFAAATYRAAAPELRSVMARILAGVALGRFKSIKAPGTKRLAHLGAYHPDGRS